MARKKQESQKPIELPVSAWMQPWEESERGWGTRPDGYWFYPTKEAAEKHTSELVKKIRANEAKLGYSSSNVPEDYSRPAGVPHLVQIPVDIAKEIKRKGWAYRDHFKAA